MGTIKGMSDIETSGMADMVPTCTSVLLDILTCPASVTNADIFRRQHRKNNGETDPISQSW